MKNLKILRENLRLNQREMALNLNLAKATYARYETGETEPNFDTLIKIADFFGCSTDYLLGHRTTNKAKYSAEQLAVLEELEKLDNEQCFAILAFIEGMKSGKEQQNKILARFRKEADEA